MYYFFSFNLTLKYPKILYSDCYILIDKNNNIIRYKYKDIICMPIFEEFIYIKNFVKYMNLEFNIIKTNSNYLHILCQQYNIYLMYFNKDIIFSLLKNEMKEFYLL